MTFIPSKLIRSLGLSHPDRKSWPVLIFIGVGFLGLATLSLSRAASQVVSVEAEIGMVAGNAVKNNSTAASGGSFVKFGSGTVTPPTPPPTGYVVKLKDFGALCNGSHNDQPALQQAVSDVTSKGGGTVLIPSGNCRMVQTASRIFTDISGTVTIRGESSSSQLSLDSDVGGAYRELFRIARGNNIAFQNLQMVRASNVYGIFININGSTDGLTIDNVVMDGKKDTIGGEDIHGIAIFGQSGNLIKNTKMTNTTIKNTEFGLFQDSGVKSITDGWLVDKSTFSGNFKDDLEFNAPSSTMTNITVTNSTFRNNKVPPGPYVAGFGIGYANVQHGLMKNNTFDGYGFDPIHIEDRSADITVEDNSFTNCSTIQTGWSSHIFIINQSHDIRVRNNTFDTSANSNTMWAVYAGRGGGSGDVYDITITGNTFKLRPNATAVGQFGTSNVKIENNTTIRL